MKKKNKTKVRKKSRKQESTAEHWFNIGRQLVDSCTRIKVIASVIGLKIWDTMTEEEQKKIKEEQKKDTRNIWYKYSDLYKQVEEYINSKLETTEKPHSIEADIIITTMIKFGVDKEADKILAIIKKEE